MNVENGFYHSNQSYMRIVNGMGDYTVSDKLEIGKEPDQDDLSSFLYVFYFGFNGVSSNSGCCLSCSEIGFSLSTYRGTGKSKGFVVSCSWLVIVSITHPSLPGFVTSLPQNIIV
jgi:hypothetical protein